MPFPYVCFSKGRNIHKILFNNPKILTSIIYDEDKTLVKERSDNAYDPIGRKINSKTFKEGGLVNNCRDYTYNEKECIYYQDEINTEGIVTLTIKHKIIFYDYSFNDAKIYTRIDYFDEKTEGYRVDYKYNEKGYGIECKIFSRGSYKNISRDFNYVGESYYSFYTNHNSIFEPSSSYGNYSEVSFTERNRISHIVYTGTSKKSESQRTDYYLNDDDQIISTKVYVSDAIYSETKDYIYNENKCEYTFVSYSHPTEEISNIGRHEIIYL